jgi:ribonuclease HI
MELTAALEALRFANVSSEVPMVVYTDSSYVINGITKWIKGWRRNGWVTLQKKEVMNRDLWEPLAEVAETRGSVEWRYVGGHIGIIGNERADEIASAYATGEAPGLFDGDKSDYGRDIDTITFDTALKEAKSSSRDRSKAKAYSYVSLVEGKVLVHKTWSECEQRVRGKTARFKKALSAEEEKEIIGAFLKK